MSKAVKRERDSSLVVSNIVHDLKTPLMAISSSLNCVKDVFPTLIKSYDLATSNKLISQDLEISFLKKVFNSIDNSIKEIELTNYNVEKIRDTLKQYSGNTNKSDRIILYDVINQAINFHKLRFENCDKKFFLDEGIRRVVLLTENKTIKKAFTYFIENIIKLSMMDKGSEIQVKVFSEKEKKLCSFVINNFSAGEMAVSSLFDQSLNPYHPKIGQGMHYFKEFLKKSGWGFRETIDKSNFKIDLVFYNNDGGNDEL